MDREAVRVKNRANTAQDSEPREPDHKRDPKPKGATA